MFYLPILKSKDGEFKALFHLDSFTRNRIKPLFEITPIEYDNQAGKKPKSFEEHIFNFCHKKFTKKWNNSECFIDTAQVKTESIQNMSCLEYIYDQLSGDLFPIIPIPVLRVETSFNDLEILNQLKLKYNFKQVAIRVNLSDIGESFSEKIKLILSALFVTPSNVHLILDLADSDFSNTNDFSDAIIDLLQDFPYFVNWLSFTICGGAFPRTGELQKGENFIPRYDWMLFKAIKIKIATQNFCRSINFGDYGIVSPGYFKFDPLKMSRSANIRYTLDEEWYVLKGTALKTREDHQQYIKQATAITNESFFLGENFSYGDSHLKSCCLGKTKTGNPTVWNGVGNNHHFTKVVADLFSTPHVSLNN